MIQLYVYIIETIRVQIVFYPLLENFQNEKSEKPWKKFVSVTIPLFNKSTMFNKSMFLELFMQTISNEMLNMPWYVCFPINSIKKQAQKLISIRFPVLHVKYVFGWKTIASVEKLLIFVEIRSNIAYRTSTINGSLPMLRSLYPKKNIYFIYEIFEILTHLFAWILSFYFTRNRSKRISSIYIFF